MDLVPIGRFSLLTRLSVKQLRHYDEIGLLRPARVDRGTGYRFYELSQARRADQIRLLRLLDVPLSRIQAIVDAGDPVTAKQHLERHRAVLQQRLADQQRVLSVVERLLTEEGPLMTVTTRTAEEQHVLRVRTEARADQMADVYGEAFEELFAHAAQAGVRPAGPPLAVYQDEEYREVMTVDLAIPVPGPAAGGGRVEPGVVPGGPVAVTTYVGDYAGIATAYQALEEWMREHGHASAGAPRERYLIGPGQTPDPEDYRTEVEWPIR